MPRILMGCLLLGVVPLVVARESDLPPDMDLGPSDRATFVLNTGGHTAPPSQLLFTPDGKKLISTAGDRTVQVWDVATGERLAVLHPPLGKGTLGQPENLTLDPQGRNLAFWIEVPGDKGKVARSLFVHDLETGATRHLGRDGGVLAFSPDGKHLALWEARNLSLINVKGGDTRRQMNVLPSPAAQWQHRGLCFSPDGKTLAAVGATDKLSLVEVASLKVRKTFTAADKGFRLERVAWADNQTLVTQARLPGNQNKEVEKSLLHVWSVDEQQPRKTYASDDIVKELPKGRYRACSDLQPAGGKKVFLLARVLNQQGAWHREGLLFDWDSGEVKRCFQYVEGPVNDAAALTGDGSLAAHGRSVTNEILLFDTGNGKLVRRLGGTPSAQPAHRWRPDGQAVAWTQTVPDRGKVLFELRLDTLNVAEKPPEALKDYPGGRQKKRGPLTVKEQPGRQALQVLGGPQEVLCKVPSWAILNEHTYTFVADDRVAVSIYGQGEVVIFDTGTGKAVSRDSLFPTNVDSMALSPDGRYLLVGSERVLAVFDPRSRKVLLRVFAAGADWIVWTPQGYYAASPGGEKLMGWSVNNGPDRLATFHPAQRFRKELYHPEVIKLVLAKGSVEEALKAARVEAQELEKILPPQTSLRHTQKGARLTVEATAEARLWGQPVVKLELLVDGRPARLPSGQAAVKSFEPPQEKDARGEWTVELEPGSHRVSVRAVSLDTYSITEEASLEEVKSAQAAPPKKHGTLYYIGIGVNQFRDEPELKLTGAVPDVQKMEKCLKEQCAGRFAEVKTAVLTDARATRQAVLDTLAELQGKLKPTDVVIVHYSSHGEVEPDGGLFLFCYDSQRGKLKETAVPGDRLRDTLGPYPCAVLLILDACHSGKFPLKSSPTDSLSRLLADDSCGVAVMTAALAHQKAVDTEKGGVFTQALIEGLSGKARPDEFSKRLYVPNLYTYVLGAVASQTENRQMPLYLPSGSVPPIVLKAKD